MEHIFFSYSRADKAFADRLRSDLESFGADVWIDVEDIHAGLKWSSAVQQALDTCEVMVVILSPDSAASQNVEDEWQYFLDQKKPLVPVLWRPAKIHFQLSRIQYIDFSSQPYDAALGQLCAELQGKGVQFSRRVPPPPNLKQGPPSKPVPLPQSYPYSPPSVPISERKPRRSGIGRLILAPFRLIFALIRAVLLLPPYLLRIAGRAAAVVVLLTLVAVVVGAVYMLWPQSDPEPKPADDPAEVVRVYFSALEARRMDLLEAILCPPVFERDRFEFEQLFGDHTYRVSDLTILEVEPVNEFKVNVHFSVTLDIRRQDGSVKKMTDERHLFYIERLNPEPGAIWCSSISLVDEIR
jgi:hypothetical protein